MLLLIAATCGWFIACNRKKISNYRRISMSYTHSFLSCIKVAGVGDLNLNCQVAHLSQAWMNCIQSNWERQSWFCKPREQISNCQQYNTRQSLLWTELSTSCVCWNSSFSEKSSIIQNGNVQISLSRFHWGLSSVCWLLKLSSRPVHTVQYYLLTNWLAYLYGRMESPRPDVMPDQR